MGTKSRMVGDWKAYVDGGRTDERLRNALLDQELPKLRHVAGRLAGRLPSSLSTEDLIQVGALALMDAARRYDPGQGVAFWSFASQRARGAMFDLLRGVDLAGRRIRTLRSQRARGAAALSHQLRRRATDEEVRQLMGLGERDWRLATAGEDCALEHQCVVAGGETSELVAHDRIEDLVRGLTLQEQTVIFLRYVSGATLRQIGEIMHVSESRISQIHSQSLKAMRRRLEEAA